MGSGGWSSETPAVVGTKDVLRTWVLALLSRVPLGAVGLIMVLQVRHLGHSYALAGACSGVCALGMALGAPVIGRLIDRGGQTMALAITGAVVGIACAVFALLPAQSAEPLFLVVALCVGLTMPPVSACARVIWRRRLDRAAFGRIVMLDATLQELAFLSGPLFLVGLAQFVGPGATLMAAGALSAGCALAYASLPETRRFGGALHSGADHHGRTGEDRAWRQPGVRLLLLITSVMGCTFGVLELGIVTAAEHHGASDLTGVLYAAMGLGSFVGGLLWSRRRNGRTHSQDAMFGLLLVLAVFSAPLGFLPSIWTLLVALVFAGLAVAPLFGVVYTLMGEVAPAASLTEAFTLQNSAITSGLAAGAALAGVIASTLGAQATFLLATLALLLGAAGYRTWRGALAARETPPAAEAAGKPVAG